MSPFTDEFETEIRALIRDELRKLSAEPLCSCLGEVLEEDKRCLVHGAWLRGESEDRRGSLWKIGS